jgi:glycosyltransferase involved in cell wall biosynthesis
MNPVRTQIHNLKAHRPVLRAFRTGVSLHSHTEFSRVHCGDFNPARRRPAAREAMASGLPVVAPRAGGVLSYCTGRNAWLVELTAEGFAAGVRAVFADDSLRAARIEQALRTAARYDWPRIAVVFFELYDELYRRYRKLYDAAREEETPAETLPAVHL